MGCSAAYLTYGCVKEKCEYHDRKFGCLITVIGKPKLGCETFASCPTNKDTPCYINNNRICPDIGTCLNSSWTIQLIIAIVLLIFLLVLFCVCLCDLIVYRQVKTYEEIGG